MAAFLTAARNYHGDTTEVAEAYIDAVTRITNSIGAEYLPEMEDTPKK
jgi:hypothetical protein